MSASVPRETPQRATPRTPSTPAPGLFGQRGFSLLELAYVVGVFAIFLVIGGFITEAWRPFVEPSFAAQEKARIESESRILADALRRWYVDEYCGGGAVRTPKPPLLPGKRLACDDLPLAPHVQRADLDIGPRSRHRGLELYLGPEADFLRDPHHGYAWSIIRSQQSPSGETRVHECTESAISDLSQCKEITVESGIPALIEIVWIPSSAMGVTPGELAELADLLGGRSELGTRVFPARIKALLCAVGVELLCRDGTGTLRIISNLRNSGNARDRAEARTLEAKLDACLRATGSCTGRFFTTGRPRPLRDLRGCSSGTSCARAQLACDVYVSNRLRLHLPRIVAVPPPEQREALFSQWIGKFSGNMTYDVNGDAVVDIRDYAALGC